jgi:WD40 repeat protein
MHQVGKAGLWRPPDLELARIWRDKQNPTLAWAKRYNVQLEKALAFLSHSESIYEDELRQKERAQKRNLKTTRAVAVILGIAAVISILFFVFGWVKKVEADKQAEIAELNRLEAEKNAEEATKQAQIAQIEAERARENERIAQANAEEAQRQREIAEIQRRRAELESKRAITNAERAELERLKAEENEKLAIMERGRAVNEAQRADRLRMLSIAQSMAMKAVNVTDNDLKALLAYQAYSFNQRYQGSAYDNFIYDGLYYANRDKFQETTGKVINQFKGHRDMVRDIAFTSDGKSFYTSGSDGKILKWDTRTKEYQTLWDPQESQVNHVMRLSPDNQWLAIGGDASYILAINLETLDSRKIYGHQGPVTELLFIPGSNNFISLSIVDKSLRLNSFEGSEELRKFDRRITSLAINPAGNILAGGDEKGTVFLWRTNNLDDVVSYQNITQQPVYALEFHPRGHLLAVGDENGRVYVCRLNERDLLGYSELTGQNSRVNNIRFSRNGELLATASLDGSIQVWVLDNLEKMLPMAFKDHHEYVWCIDFTPDGDYLMAGTRSGNLKLWPTRLNLLAQDICQYLMRNMNRVEWNRYVGEDIPYERTCESAGTTSMATDR